MGCSMDDQAHKKMYKQEKSLYNKGRKIKKESDWRKFRELRKT